MTSAAGLPPVLAIDGISVTLDGERILHDVSMRVSAGEFVVVLGANGSGKSTLVRAAVGLVPTVAGSIELFGTARADFTDHHRIGYVPQRTSAVGGVPATVHEVVASGRLPYRKMFRRLNATDLGMIDGALERVDLSARRNSPMSDLSGGQQQRVLIARALATGADLLIMDEPTAGVDHDRQHNLAELMGGLVAGGTSVLLVAHELGPMALLVDRAVVVDHGHIAFDGPVGADLDAAVGHTIEGITGHGGHAHTHTAKPTREGISSHGVWR